MKTLIITILLTLTLFPSAFADRDRLKYNPLTNEWKYAAPEDQLKYNAIENEWSHESPDSHLRFNPFSDKWEWAN